MGDETMRAFVESCIERDHKRAQEKSQQAPIHESGCYYYNYSLDAGWFCDCDGPAVALIEAETKRSLLALGDDRVLLLLARNYQHAAR